MKDVTFSFVSVDELGRYQRQLEELEKEFYYPLDKSQFFQIYHGKKYSSFFERIGKSKFVILQADDTVIGIMAVIFKTIRLGTRSVNAIYFADLKIKSSYRGRNLSSKTFLWTFLQLLGLRDFWKSHFYYFVSMEGERGDVLKTAGRLSLMQIFQRLAQFSVFFADPRKAALINEADIEEEITGSILDLSPATTEILFDTPFISLCGEKDLIINNQSTPLRLAHLRSISALGRAYLRFLRDAGMEASRQYESLCFCLDTRRKNLIQYLESFQITPIGTANVYGFSWNGIGKDKLCQIGTFQI